jgi:D-glycero-alpha-D-manno-heptose-7-phosphate kinase
MVISRTPYRISFFGGGTDYPAWYRENGGAVLGTAIDKYCFITCRYLPPFFEHRLRLVYSKIEDCQRASEIQHPVVRTVLACLGSSGGWRFTTTGICPPAAAWVPARPLLSGSSRLCMASSVA